MKNDLINIIVSVVNSNSSFSEKRTQFRQERCRRRGKNRILLSVIIDLFSEYTLPLSLEDSLSVHSLDELTSKEYDMLLSVARRSSCKYFQAICFDIIWEHYHKIDLANKALKSYFNMLQSETDDYKKAAFVIAVCRIYSKTKSAEFDISSLHHLCMESIIPSLPTSERYTHIILKSLLLSSNSKELENYITTLIKTNVTAKEYYEAIYLTEILVEVYKKEKRNSDRQALLCDLAKYNEGAANLLNWDDPQNARRIIHLIQKAMSLWTASHSSSANEERKRLAKKIEPVKKLSLSNIKSIPGGKFDLTEVINKMRSITENSSFEECIWNFIRAVKLITPQNLKERHKKNGFFLSTFFGTTILDSDGRIKCIIPALHNADSKDQLHVWEHEAESDYDMYADAFISRYLYIIREHFSFTEESLQFIVDNNVFIPEDRKKSFLKGLTAGFNYDYITALSILMPQVENAIRCLARDCGAVVYKTKDDGVEECLSLESILNLPEITECLDPVLLFNLKVFYTSDYGFGMRNMVGHGLMSDAELSSRQGLIVWWFTLHICCIYSPELIKRVSQKIEEKEHMEDI